MTVSTDSPILSKTLELCQTILDQDEFQKLRQNIDQFMADDAAQQQYQTVVEKHQSLQHKQQQAEPLTEAEIADFEKHRQALFDNPVARGFMDAQEEFQRMQQTITRYVHKTFEIGRVPTSDDFESCGHGCSCGH